MGCDFDILIPFLCDTEVSTEAGQVQTDRISVRGIAFLRFLAAERDLRHASNDGANGRLH